MNQQSISFIDCPKCHGKWTEVKANCDNEIKTECVECNIIRLSSSAFDILILRSKRAKVKPLTLIISGCFDNRYLAPCYVYGGARELLAQWAIGIPAEPFTQQSIEDVLQNPDELISLINTFQ